MICEEAAIGYAMLRTENLHEIQFLLEHFSVQTTERYLGCKQRVQNVVNGSLEIELRRLCAPDSWLKDGQQATTYGRSHYLNIDLGAVPV
jgi:hypothetical protein